MVNNSYIVQPIIEVIEMKNRLYGPKRMFCANVHKKEKNNTDYNGKEIVNHNKNNIKWYNIIFIYFYLMNYAFFTFLHFKRLL